MGIQLQKKDLYMDLEKRVFKIGLISQLQ